MQKRHSIYIGTYIIELIPMIFTIRHDFYRSRLKLDKIHLKVETISLWSQSSSNSGLGSPSLCKKSHYFRPHKISQK